mmetsp:Transcript_8873/g.36642  ORF Transcript_8873/g.36642 Transcript_8873/m.36642 type:complete len:175 (+) Transcript_8873:2393-2917(+)
MNVDGMHKGRLEHTKLLARHAEFDCPLDASYRGHHIGVPRVDAGAHELEAEVALMLNNRYGNRKSMTGNYDTHMPVLLADSKFVYSPNGVGEACFREYEALITGAVPVVDESAYHHRRRNLRALPMLRVSNWSDVTPAFLERKWAEFGSKDFDVAMLYLPYWYDLILSAMGIEA